MSKITIDRSVVEQALEALEMMGTPCPLVFLPGEIQSWQNANEALRAALEQPQDHIEQHLGMVPAGWRLVPVTPTPEMIRVMCAYDGTQYSNTFDSDDFKEDYRNMLAAAPQPPALEQPQVEQEPVAWQSIEAMAVQRYKVVPAHDSMFYRHAVVAGDGTQQLYIGRETECENIARRFAGAFLDGAYEASLYTQPQNLSCKSNQARLATLWGYVKEQPPRQPLTDEQVDGLLENVIGSLPVARELIRAIERAHGITGEQA